MSPTFFTFVRFSGNPKRDFLRFFCRVSYVFSNYVDLTAR